MALASRGMYAGEYYPNIINMNYYYHPTIFLHVITCGVNNAKM